MKYKEFKQKWLSAFAPHITKSQYKKISISYLWSIFVSNLVDFLEKEEAIAAFRSMCLEDCFYIETFLKGSETFPLDSNTKHEDIEDIPEIYVVANDYSWTYVCTHEDFLGPYFIKIK